MAPKTHARIPQNGRTTSQSIASASRRSVGGKSNPGSTSRRSQRNESTSKDAIFQRAVDRSFCGEWFDEDDLFSTDVGLKVWLDCDIMSSKLFKGVEWALVSVVRPAGLTSHIDPQKIREAENNPGGKPALKVVAKAVPWNDAPDTRHISLSSALCSALGCRGIVGALVRIGPAPPPSPIDSVEALKIFPFQISGSRENDGLRFGEESTTNREAVAQKIREYYSNGGHSLSGAFNGPLTDGVILSNSKGSENKQACDGILIRFDPPSSSGMDFENHVSRWILGDESKSHIDVQTEIPNPLQSFGLDPVQAHFPLKEITPMIGIGKLIDQLFSHMLHCSSVLLTGGLGSGKSSLVCLLGHKLRSTHFFHTSYFPCREMVTDEARVSTIKESLHKLFMTASWGTRLGGRAVVILDDLDRLCPAEEELQVGANNERSRQISELISSMVHQYCGVRSEIVLLATAQSKENVNSVIVGGHVVREIISLKAPNKDARRSILQGLVGGRLDESVITNGRTNITETSHQDDEAAWMANEFGSSESSHGPATFEVDPNIDFLELAGQTDGYMPGDLVLLVSRAKSEALVRTVESTSDSNTETRTRLMKEDFKQALEGFTPASLRNVTLQASTTTFDAIGGLHETRKILLETLEYPTTYAPIFAQCPLRLRSGLLLYGYPGCGKTLLASAVAGECGLNFISVKGPEILNKYIGASEKSVRDLFERAEAARPCVLFFDEFDSIAPKRGHDSTGVTDRVVNQLLTQMDGAEGLSGVYVLAATSRPDLIDPALLRPGRLDKSIICDLPNLDDRLDILQALSKNLVLSQDILNATDPHESLIEIAHRTEGYSGADLQAVIYNAHLEAIQGFLGDEPELMGNGTGRQTTHQQRKINNSYSSKARKKILAFRYGHPDNDPTPPPEQTKLNPRYHAILEYLDSMKKSRRRTTTATTSTKNNNNNNNHMRRLQQGVMTSKGGPSRTFSSSSSIASTTTTITGLDSSSSSSPSSFASSPHHHQHHQHHHHRQPDYHHDHHAQREKSLAIMNTKKNGYDDDEDEDEDEIAGGGDSFSKQEEEEEKKKKEEKDEGKEEGKVRIEWRHLQASMASTRKSISEQERRRLAGIYKEFLVGRNGEMPNGQGSLEVGGRVSLM